jgi:hypothetical protein
MVRLLARVRASPAEADLFAALVLACRFCGLLDASVAADRRARRLDPGIRTSVAYTLFVRGEYAAATAVDDDDLRWLRLYALPLLGREEEALRVATELLARVPEGSRPMVETTHAALRRDRGACVAATDSLLARGLRDPESLYFCARNTARVGETDRALDLLARVVHGGFHNAAAFRRDPWFDPLRRDPRFAALLAEADAGQASSREALRAAGGDGVLGPTGATSTVGS